MNGGNMPRVVDPYLDREPSETVTLIRDLGCDLCAREKAACDNMRPS